MKLRKTFPLILILLLTITTVLSQSKKKFIDTVDVAVQFDNLMNNSNRYQKYKVVEATWLIRLKSNVIDTLSASKKVITDNYKVINSQNYKIDSLEKSLATSNETIINLENNNQSISLFGLRLKKSLFKIIMFFIIGVLLVLLLFFISKFNRRNSITKEVKLKLSELEEEFESHRKRALEREQKVRRQLQDEWNKQKKD